jgi:hypothetical protein
MKRTSALLVSLAIGVAAIFGVFAVSRTLSLGSHARGATDAQVAAKTRQLARYEASLRKALAQKPPALPASASRPATAPAPQPAQAVRVVYHRPPPIVIHKHRAGGEDSYEQADGGGADD